MRTTHRLLVAAGLLVALVGCSSDDSGTAATTTTAAPTTTSAPTTTTEAPTTTAAPDPLTIVVTNDDGIDSAGIAAVANALAELDDVEVIVVAPATNQSGTSDTTSATPVTYEEKTGTNGLHGYAVNGTPADSVNVALDQLGIEPDLVVSGTNAGQNVGPAVPLSGTVGAARTAARRGIPAIAVSGNFDFTNADEAAALVIAEIEAHRDEYGFGADTNHTVVNINLPTCTAGATRGIVDVAVGADAATFDYGKMDCASTATDPVDDLAALMMGYAARSIVNADL